jgi:AmiR/NasT family two-component response regulator
MERVTLQDQQLLRKLRTMRALVIHPPGEEKDRFVAHIKRIGCQVSVAWPAPAELPVEIDVVFFQLSRIDDTFEVSWMTNAPDVARIAIISYETPEILSALERLCVHGVISSPVRLFGIFAVLVTALGVARHEKKLRSRVHSLDNTLKSRRKVEKAVSILSGSRDISEDEAYKRIRDKSMKSKRSIGDVADAIIDASDI